MDEGWRSEQEDLDGYARTLPVPLGGPYCCQRAYEKAGWITMAISRRREPGTPRDLEEFEQCWEAESAAFDAYELAVRAFLECTRSEDSQQPRLMEAPGN